MLRLLVDTGASYTLIPIEAAERLGVDLAHPIEKVRIVAANGVLIAPRVAIPAFDCLGRHHRGFPVLAFTLPAETYVDGLLGMDFLGRQRFVFDLGRGTVNRIAHRRTASLTSNRS